MTTIRLPNNIEKQLDIIAKLEHKTKSDIIKKALNEYLMKINNNESFAYEIGKDYFGKYGSGESDRSTNYKKIIKEKISGKINN